VRRADRLFDILQALRAATKPMTASVIADRLEVTVRTIYRDIASLQASRIPIEGAPGIGYVLRRGFDLPPLMFTADEVDAIAVGALLVRRPRDPGLQVAADRVLEKVTAVLPETHRGQVLAAPFFVSDGDAETPTGVDLADLRLAIRETRKLRLTYADQHSRQTERIVWPVAMAYYVDVTLLGAWCELRGDFRHFRVERIVASALLEERFSTDNGALMQRWFALQSAQAAKAQAGDQPS
jgi:predicted DNA-binding transcriptional regulator YafY